MIYADNNATTMMPPNIVAEMIKWVNMGNASADYASAERARKMMADLRAEIGLIAGIPTCCDDIRDTMTASTDIYDIYSEYRTIVNGPNELVNEQTTESSINRSQDDKFDIIFTSGGSENNAYIISAVVSTRESNVPHIVMSSIEHKSLLLAAEEAVRLQQCTLTKVSPRIDGHVYTEDVERALTPATRLVCIMHANNELGAVNDVAAIAAAAHAYNSKIHVYSDTVQTFGKLPMPTGIDSFSISFHKVYGPPGVGAIAVRRSYAVRWHQHPLIYGSQNHGMRGGTENVIGLGGALAAVRFCWAGRASKNRHLASLQQYVITKLNSYIPVVSYMEYYKRTTTVVPPIRNSGNGNGRNYDHDRRHPSLEFVLLTAGVCLPNTVMLAIVSNGASTVKICNKKIKLLLEQKKIIISVGSACNTTSPKASHVLYAIGADDKIRAGALRISFGDHSTLNDARAIVRELLNILLPQKK